MEKNGLIVSLLITSVLLVGSIGFGAWAFMGRQDYKNNVDTKVGQAVETAEVNLTLKKDAEFAEEYKKPFSIYKGPSEYGTLTITYPKTWSNYVNQQAGSTLLDGYMHKDFVSADTQNTHYAFRYQVTSSPYDQELKMFESTITGGQMKSSAYSSPKQPSARAIRLEGIVDNNKSGVMVLIELRGNTIKVWTEGDSFRNDFESILKDLTFIQ